MSDDEHREGEAEGSLCTCLKY